mmetsp:Transcript_12311/g.14108  ORF Transcript_12311/g.14108 Transcript_12311/m.14108 type:complete len:602 (+) Transcript_12311:28-1833(+)
MDAESSRERDQWEYADNVYSSTQITLSFALPLLTSFLSLVGSATIVCILIRKKRNRLSSTYNRIIFGMSSMDILSSTANLLSVLPSPSDTPQMVSFMRYPGYGTTATCTAQGFFFYSGQLGTTLYYCALTVYYVTVVTTNTSESTLKTIIEPFFHGIPILYSFLTGIFLAVTDNFNNAGHVCWIAPYPVRCRIDFEPCTRGKYAVLYRWMLQGIPVITAFFVILACMIRLICAVRKQDRRMRRYSFNTTPSPPGLRRSSLRRSISRYSITGSHGTSYNNDSSRQSVSRNTQRTTTQAFLYIAAYFTTFIFCILHQLVYSVSKKVVFNLYLLQQTTLPAQGFFNFLVFIRPRIQNISKNNPELGYIRVFLEAIRSSGEETQKRRRSSVQTKKTIRRSAGSSITGLFSRVSNNESSNRDKRLLVKRDSVHSAVLQAQKELMEDMNLEDSLSSDSDELYSAVAPSTKTEGYSREKSMNAPNAVFIAKAIKSLSFSYNSDKDYSAISPAEADTKKNFLEEITQDDHFIDGDQDTKALMTERKNVSAVVLQTQRDLKKLDLVDSDSEDDKDYKFEDANNLSSSSFQDLPAVDGVQPPPNTVACDEC